jgi:hypothetical protein
MTFMVCSFYAKTIETKVLFASISIIVSQESNRMNKSKCLITIATKEFQDILDISSPTHEYFADLFGYDYKVFDKEALEKLNIQEERTWKLRLFQELSDDYEAMFYIDSDAMFRKFTRDPFGEMYVNSFQGLVLELDGPRFNPNAGVWLMKSNEESAEFIEAALAQGVLTSRWADQSVVAKTLGWNLEPFPGGDKLINPSKFLKNTVWLDPTWNYMPGYPYTLDDPHIIHFAGSQFTKQDRIELMSTERNSLQRKSMRRLPWEAKGSSVGFKYPNMN